MQHVRPANVEQPRHRIGRADEKAGRALLLNGLPHAGQLGARIFAREALLMNEDRRMDPGGAVLPDAVYRVTPDRAQLEAFLGRLLLERLQSGDRE